MYANITPEIVASSATDLETIGAALARGSAAAAGPATGVMAAAADEVSEAITALFSSHAQQFQALARQAAAFHHHFTANLLAAANSYSAIEAASNAVINAIVVGGNPFAVAVNPSTGNLYLTDLPARPVVTVVDPAAQQPVVTTISVGASSTSAVGGDPFAAAFDPTTGKVYAVNTEPVTVSVINSVTNTVPVSAAPIGVAVSPTGPQTGHVYVTNSGNNTVSVINPTTNTVTATVPVGYSPDGVAVGPTGTVYVTDFESNTVSVIS